MTKALYTAFAHVVGGRDGHGASDDGALDVLLRRPTDLGGEGGGTNPEQLFAVGYAACFESALGAVSRRQRIKVGEITIDSSVSLHAREGGTFVISVELNVTLSDIDGIDVAKQLVRAAHNVCPYSNAIRGNVDVALMVNGEPA